MNYQQIRDQFYLLLNRNDCTDDQADLFISLGLTRTARKLRTPIQKFTASVVIDELYDEEGIRLPADYLGMYEVRVDGKRQDRLSRNQAQDFYGFYIQGAFLRFSYDLELGQTVEIEYYADFLNETGDTDINPYALVIPDVILYAALIYAADVFTDARKMDWSNTFIALAGEVQEMADEFNRSGGSMFITPYGGGVA